MLRSRGLIGFSQAKGEQQWSRGTSLHSGPWVRDRQDASGVLEGRQRTASITTPPAIIVFKNMLHHVQLSLSEIRTHTNAPYFNISKRTCTRTSMNWQYLMMLPCKYQADALAVSTTIIFIIRKVELAQTLKETMENSTEWKNSENTLSSRHNDR